MINKICKDVLEELHYTLDKESLESGSLSSYYSYTDKSKVKYEVVVTFIDEDKYLFSYKDSTGGCCNYTYLHDFISHLLTVNGSYSIGSEDLEDAISKVLLPLPSDNGSTSFGGDLGYKKL